MKHNVSLKTVFSLCLALCLLVSAGGASACAENVNRLVEVNASGRNASETYGSIQAVIDDPFQPGNVLSVQAQSGCSAEVSAGSVSATGGFPTAVFVSAYDQNSLSRVTVSDGVTAQGEDTAFGVAVSTFDGGTAEIRVNGGGVSAASDEYAFGLHARSFGPGTIKMEVSGDVSAIGASQARGVVLAAPESGSAALTINGKVAASSTRDGAAAEIDLGENAAGQLLFRVNGDLSCSETALLIQNDSDSASAVIVVDGTIKGGQRGIRISDREKTGNLRLVAWKISRSSQGAVVETANGSAATELQQAISYIIRMSAPSGVKLRVSGITYEEDLGLYTAHEGDTITLYPEAESGVTIAGVYNGDSALKQGADGGYSLTVPRGGGVEVRVELG